MHLQKKLSEMLDNSEQLFKQFIILLNEKYNEYSYADLFADKLRVSQKRLNEVARQVSGKTACCLVEEKIVLEAKKYLEDTPLMIKEISWKLGYEDQYYFSRVFKKQTGFSPRQYRLQIVDAK
jgi:AraC family transcriptional regulator, transcriptional activator of pobA